MYAFIKGSVFQVNSDNIIVENSGIGYRVYMPNTHNIKKNQDIMVFTYQQIKEDAHILFGFLNDQEYALFLELISVKGVGCKSAIGILNGSDVKDIINAIENSDVAFMKRLPGIGTKTASQIILDLKGKLVQGDSLKTSKSASFTEVEGALKSLGYKANEISPILKQLPTNEDNIDKLIKLALGIIAKAKGA